MVRLKLAASVGPKVITAATLHTFGMFGTDCDDLEYWCSSCAARVRRTTDRGKTVVKGFRCKTCRQSCGVAPARWRGHCHRGADAARPQVRRRLATPDCDRIEWPSAERRTQSPAQL